MVNRDDNRQTVNLHKRDWVILLGAISIVMGGLLYIFQPRALSIEQHAAIEQKVALDKQEAKLRWEFDKEKQDGLEEQMKNILIMQDTQDENLKRLMWQEDIRPMHAPKSVKDAAKKARPKK
jgi:hypothetical protein